MAFGFLDTTEASGIPGTYVASWFQGTDFVFGFLVTTRPQ